MLWYQVTHSTLSDKCFEIPFNECINSAFHSHTVITCKVSPTYMPKNNCKRRHVRSAICGYVCVCVCMHVCVCVCVHAHTCVCNQYSWNMKWILCHWRSTPVPLFHFLTISNNNLADWQTWEVEAALLPFT